MIERYTLKDMGNLWSEENKFKTWLEVEIAVCEAFAKKDIIPADVPDTIRQKARIDVEAIKKGFHPSFNIIGLGRDDIWKYPIYSWMKSVKQRKKDGKYPPKEKITFKFLIVDVVGNAGMAKIEFYKGDKLAYTDFLSLYKFSGGWRVVAKIYYEHKTKEKK